MIRTINLTCECKFQTRDLAGTKKNTYVNSFIVKKWVVFISCDKIKVVL